MRSGVPQSYSSSWRLWLFLWVSIILVSTSLSAPSQSALAAPCGPGTAYGAPVAGKIQITSAANLIYLSNTSSDWNRDFLQTVDIDLSSCEFTPIGTDLNKFTGNYDGGGHSVSNLLITSSAINEIGLFGFISGATIENLEVQGSINVANTNAYVGGVVGRALSSAGAESVVSKVKSEVNIQASTDNYIGGLVGELNGPGGSVRYSSYYGEITATGTWASIGGISGFGSAEISNSYALSSVAGGFNVGGINGHSTPIVSRSYAASAGSDRGISGSGLSGSSSGNFWDTEVSGTTTSQTGSSGKTTSEMKTLSTFQSASWGIVSAWEAWDPSNNKIWGICSSINGGYPYLLWEYQSDPCPSSGGGVGGGSGGGESPPLDPRQLAATGTNESSLVAIALFGVIAVFVGAMLVLSRRRTI